MSRNNSEKNRGVKRAHPKDLEEDDDNLSVKIKKENDNDVDPCFSGILDTIEFKSQIDDDLNFEHLATNGSSDVKLLVKLVTSMAGEIKKLSSEVQQIRSILEGKLVGTSSITVGQNFQSKYLLDLPLKTLEEFDSFDERLKEDEEFRNDFASSLILLFDLEEKLSRSMTNILRRYLGRDLAMNFTAAKQSASKLVFKDTKFCSCMFDLIVQLSENDPRKVPMTEKKFYQTLSGIFPNAKDWDGYRSLRRRPPQISGEDEYDDILGD